jgi:hypothetical protein
MNRNTVMKRVWQAGRDVDVDKFICIFNGKSLERATHGN